MTRQKIGMVFQQFNLFANMTNKSKYHARTGEVGVMTKDEASKKADELLTRIGLLDKADAYRRSFPEDRSREWQLSVHLL